MNESFAAQVTEAIRSSRPLPPMVLAVGALLLMASVPASARSFRVAQIPNGNVFGCANCHTNPSGGGARNAFGQAVGAITGSANKPFWSATLAGLDSDGDGTTNGLELGDPDGDGKPVAGAKVTNPGNASSKPPANLAPSVSITEPANDAVFSQPAVVVIKAAASDTDGTIAKVEIFDGATLVGTDTSSPFEWVLDLAPGTHSFSTKATDDKGLITTSAGVQVTVQAPAPIVLGELQVTATNLVLNWAGGGGPFGVQQQDGPSEPWRLVAGTNSARLTAVRSATASLEGKAGVLRVVDLATQTAPFPCTVELSGSNERPDPLPVPGTGTGVLRVESNVLYFDIQYSGLTGPATMAHIHGRAPSSSNAGVIIDLSPFSTGALGVAGSISGSVTLTVDQKAAIMDGLTYVNIHTAANKSGEIRGQVVPTEPLSVLLR